MTKDEALAFDLALEALEAIINWYGVRDKNDVMMPLLNQNPEIKESMDAITAIKQARSAPAQPASEEDIKVYRAIADNYRKDLAAAQRQWVGLTDDDYVEMGISLSLPSWQYKAIEAKLRSKNNGN